MLASTLADVTLALPDILGSVVLMVADKEAGLAVACASSLQNLEQRLFDSVLPVLCLPHR